MNEDLINDIHDTMVLGQKIAAITKEIYRVTFNQPKRNEESFDIVFKLVYKAEGEIDKSSVLPSFKSSFRDSFLGGVYNFLKSKVPTLKDSDITNMFSWDSNEFSKIKIQAKELSEAKKLEEDAKAQKEQIHKQIEQISTRIKAISTQEKSQKEQLHKQIEQLRGRLVQLSLQK